MDEEKYTYNENTYTQRNYGDGNPAVNPYATVQPVKVKKPKKQHKFFKKAMAAICLGGLFGSCAAGAFYGITELAGNPYSIVSNKDGSSSEVEELKQTVSSLETALLKNNNENVDVQRATMVATDVTDVVDKVMPSMVAVTNQYEAITNYWGRSYVQDAEASGSGIIVGESDTEFFIATNHHVIDSAKNLTVQFVDGTTASAYVKGSDSDIDIAVIAVKKADLTTATIKAVTVAEMGDSDSLNIGEPAIAIGNALGYGQSVTTGVISAVNRKIEDSEYSAEGLIQTSAAINPGNSGGALLNTFGQVIGINSSKIGGSTIEGMGFAIPINAVKDLISEYSLRETKEKVSEENRGYLGIEGTYDDYSAMGYPKGAFVVKVTEGSAAEAAGIYFGDTITKFDGQTVTGFEGLRDIMSYYKAGDTVDVTLQRNVNGKFEEITVSVTLGKRPAAED